MDHVRSGAGASLNGQIDSSNDGIADSFGWGLHFGPHLITDYDRIMNAFIDVLNAVDRAVDFMRGTAYGGYWKDFYMNAHPGWARGWSGIEDKLIDLYRAVNEVYRMDYAPAESVSGKLAVLTPAQVLASIFGSNVIVTKESV